MHFPLQKLSAIPYKLHIEKLHNDMIELFQLVELNLYGNARDDREMGTRAKVTQGETFDDPCNEISC